MAKMSDGLLLRGQAVEVTIDNRTLLSATDLDVTHGLVVAVVGPSGAGKTTLLACLAGLRLPSSGTVLLLDEDLTKLSAGQRAKKRLSSIGFVFQHADLLPELTPVENVMLPGLLLGGDSEGVRRDADWLIADLGVRTDADTADLSGGEAQRLALARALITRPSVLLADEPTGSLDTANRDDVLELMLSKIRSENMGAVLATHDDVVASRADVVVRIG